MTLHVGSDVRRLPTSVLADELAETNDSVRATALLREMKRQRIDRAAGDRFIVWRASGGLVVMERALLAAAVEGAPHPPPNAA